MLASAVGAAGQVNTINTVMGGGPEAATAASAYLPEPFAAVRDANGNTYISVPTLNEVFKVDTSGNLTIYAGTGIEGFSGDGGAATQAQLAFPEGLAIDKNGNLFIADMYNERIRRVDATTHVITTVAGSEDPYFGSYAGDGGAATDARLNGPEAVAVDANGNLFIADTNNGVVRRVDATTGNISTYAGNISATAAGCPSGSATATSVGFGYATGVAVDASGNVFVSDEVGETVCKVTTSQTISVYAGTLFSAGTPGQSNGDGGPAASALLLAPRGLTTDPTGNLYIVDAGEPKIRKVDTTTNHIITTVAGIGLICGTGGITPAEPGCGDGGAATSAAFDFPESVFYDSLGNLVVTDTYDMRVRVVSSGTNPTIAGLAGGGTGGDGGGGTSGIMGLPQTVGVDASENVYALETNGERLRELNASTGNLSTVAGDGYGGATVTCNGSSCSSGSSNGDGGTATQARFVYPNGVAIDGSGNYYILDGTTAVVRIVNKQTSAITVAGVTIQPGNIATIAGNGASCGSSGNPNAKPSCGDGGAATSASLYQPNGIAVDASGIVYIADSGLNTVRAVNTGTSAALIAGVQIAAGDIATIAGISGSSCGTYLNGGCGNYGMATSATLNSPLGLVASGTDLYIADAGDNVVRDLALETGTISPYAFNGLPTFGGDDGNMFSSSMEGPSQLALDNRGNLYIGGGYDNVVQRVDASDGTVVTVAGDVNNLVGGSSGDGGPSTSALIGNYGLAIFNATFTNGTSGTQEPTDDLFISDGDGNRIRRVNLAPVTIEDGSFSAFGPSLAGSLTNLPQFVDFANDGLDDLILTAKVTGANASAFTLPAANGPNGAYVFQVSPGNAGEISVSFNPPVGVSGTLTATLTITTNDKANPSFTFSLTGTVSGAETLSVNVTPAPGSGAGGSVTSSPSGSPQGIFCSSDYPAGPPYNYCSASFAAGTSVTLFASPDTGYAFSAWNTANAPDASSCNGSASPSCTFTITGPDTVNASFTTSSTLNSYTITVVGYGNGSGTVTGGVVGGPQINCTITNGVAGSTGCTQTFSSTTNPSGVTLTSTASTGGSVFAGYLGTCTASATSASQCTTLPITSSVAAVFSGPPVAFSSGQVFLDFGPMVFVLNPSTGGVVQVLNNSQNGYGEGMTFDSVGNLYIANDQGFLSVFSNKAAGPTQFGNYGGDNAATSVVFDPSGDALLAENYITGDDQATLLEYAPGTGANGAPSNTFYPAFINDSPAAYWIELLDSNDTIAYTLGSNTAKVYDLGESVQHPDIIPNPALTAGESLYALRELPDGSLLVAAADRIIRMNQDGTVLQSYQQNTSGIYQNLNLDPDGVSFWTNDELTGKVYRINISSGAVMNGSGFTTNLGFESGIVFQGISGVAIYGQPQSGGADVSVTMTATPSSVTTGNGVNYAITVTNNGPLGATGVSMTDAIPTTATLSSLSGTGCETQINIGSGQTTVFCNIGALQNGQKSQITFTLTPTLTGTLTNTATVAAASPADPDQTNNTATTNTTVTSGTLESLNIVMAGTAEGTVTDNLGQINCQETNSGAESGNCTTSYPSGTQVTLTATALGAFGGFGGSPTACTGSGTTCQVTVTANETVTATFNPGTSTFPLTVQAGSTHTGGGTVTSSPAGINCTVTGTATSGTCSANFPVGEFVTISAAAASGSTFFGWTGTTPTCITSSSVSCLVAMTGAETVDAGFTSGGATVSVTVNGAGNVEDKTNPTSINCTNTAAGPQSGACSAGYSLSTAVTLTETPASGATFVSWGGGVCANPTSTTCTFTASTATTYAITATFQSASGGGVTFTSTTLPSGAVSVPYGADIQALVNGGTGPYTISLQSGSSLPAGFTFETPSASGNVAQGHIYNDSPATAGTFTFGVTVTDSSSPAQVANATLSVTIGTLPNTQAGLLTGQYAVEIVAYPDCGFSGNNCPTGTSSTESLFVGGLTFDGKGGVTGVMDASTPALGIQQDVAVTGTYTVGPDNRGYLVIPPGVGNTGIHSTFSVGTVYRGLAYSARFTGFRDDDGNHEMGSGFLLKQDPTAFSQSSFAGTYVYGVSGQSAAGLRTGLAGLITFDNALHVVSGAEDVNEGGSLGSYTSITGSYTAPDTNGRTQLSLTLSNSNKSSNSTVAVYIVSANEVIPMNLDPRANNEVTTGTAMRQANPGSFTASSLAGPDVASLAGVSNGGTFAGVGVFSVSGGTLTVTLDHNDGGTLSLGDVATGTATVAANGRVPFSVTDKTTGAPGAGVIYLAGPDSGYVLIADSSVALGPLALQVGGPFAGTSFTGNLYFGQQESVSGVGSDFSGVSTSVATGTFNATDDESHHGGDLLYDENLGAITYSVDATGHVTGQVSDGSGITGYLVSPYELAIFDTTGPASDPAPSSHPNLVLFQTIAAPKGTPSPASTSVNFSTPVTAGSSAQSSPITITNTGLGPLGITGVDVANSPDFSASGGCVPAGTGAVVVLQPSGSCTFTVTFAPPTTAASGAVSQTLVLTTDGTSNVTVAATGTVGSGTTYTLTVTDAGAGKGTVTSQSGLSPAINCTTGSTTGCTANYAPATAVTLTATPASGSAFAGWSGACTNTTGTCAVTVNAAESVTATFNLVPALSITKTHTGNFIVSTQGTYTVTVSNGANAAPTTSAVTVTENLPAALGQVASMTGTGWTCTTTTCTRSDALAAGASYPAITVTINVAATAPGSQQANSVTVSGGGSASATAMDPTTVQTAPALAITKTHTGSFVQGLTGTYTVTVSNGAGSGPTIGTVTVAENPPSGLTIATMAGTGWTCSASSCTRSDALAGGAAYPAIAVTVNVATSATSPQVNSVTVSGGGSANATATDSTAIVPPAPVATLNPPGGSTLAFGGEGIGSSSAAQTVTITNTGNANLTVSAIGISEDSEQADFTQTNNCTAALTPSPGSGSSCTINVVFTPTTIGPLTATLNISSNDPNNPRESLTLTGTGSTLSLSVGPGGSTTVTVNPGGTAVYGLLLNAPPGTTGTATLTCSSPDSSITCQVVPTNVVLTGKPVQTAIVVDTYCQGAVPVNTPANRLPMAPIGALTLLAALGMAAAPKAQRRRLRLALAPAILAAVLIANAACGNLPKSPTGAATPPGTYTLNITATLNNSSFTLPVTLIVK